MGAGRPAEAGSSDSLPLVPALALTLARYDAVLGAPEAAAQHVCFDKEIEVPVTKWLCCSIGLSSE